MSLPTVKVSFRGILTVADVQDIRGFELETLLSNDIPHQLDVWRDSTRNYDSEQLAMEMNAPLKYHYIHSYRIPATEDDEKDAHLACITGQLDENLCLFGMESLMGDSEFISAVRLKVIGRQSIAVARIVKFSHARDVFSTKHFDSSMSVYKKGIIGAAKV